MCIRDSHVHHPVDKLGVSGYTLQTMAATAIGLVSVSYTHLNAIKTERQDKPQQKPSILKKLDGYKKQAAKQPKQPTQQKQKDMEVSQ